MTVWEEYTRQAELLKALAHPLRLQLVHELMCSGCRSVRCLEEHTGVSQSCVSQHLQRLRSTGVVEAERSGNQVYYRVASPQAEALVRVLMSSGGEGGGEV